MEQFKQTLKNELLMVINEKIDILCDRYLTDVERAPPCGEKKTVFGEKSDNVSGTVDKPSSSSLGSSSKKNWACGLCEFQSMRPSEVRVMI